MLVQGAGTSGARGPGLGRVFPTELAESNDFARRVTDYVAVITRDGVRAAAREAARSRTSRPHASPAA